MHPAKEGLVGEDARWVAAFWLADPCTEQANGQRTSSLSVHDGLCRQTFSLPQLFTQVCASTANAMSHCIAAVVLRLRRHDQVAQ